MSSLPFWALSPSPYTILFWAIMALWGTLNLPLRRNRLPGLNRLLDALWILGLVVLPFDAVWCLFQGVRFASIHPQGVLQLAICFLRDIAGFILCLTMARPYFAFKVTEFRFWGNVIWLCLLGYMVVWFWYAPSPAWTDWTYGLRFGASPETVTLAFLISHVGAKFFQGLIYISLFDPMFNMEWDPN